MLATHLAAVAALATTSISVASGQSHYTLHERRDTEASSPWVKREALDADVILPLRIGLMQSNLDKGYTWLIEVYVLPCVLARSLSPIVRDVAILTRMPGKIRS